MKRTDAAPSPTPATWTFEYSADPFRSDALLDLRSLNEKVAGESGFVKRTPDGSGFLMGSGKPVRFWAVNTTLYRHPGGQPELERHARFLAKIGVNMVRMHGSFSPKGAGKKITEVDEEELDRCWRLVAAMKKQGIYTTISPYWANGGHAGTAASWGIEGYGDGADLWGLLFFNDRLRDAYKGWMKALYTRKNPYTGIALAHDPAVAIIQVQNEDSLFFWTMQALKSPQKELLAQKFAAWLGKQYGSLKQATDAWENFGFEGDDWGQGKVGLMNVYQMTQPQSGGAAKRLRDEVRFYAETQRDFYADIARFYRTELGCKQLMNASNWITADPEKLNDLERWTYTATDIQAVNKYYNGGPHLGPNNGWRIDPGDRYALQSALTNPSAVPTNLKQGVGYPMLVPESTWVSPLEYQAEAPLLMAAYQSLTGAGPYYWFSADSSGFDTDPYFPYHTFPDGQKGILKFRLPPAIQTGFPAAALMYRRGDVKPGATVVHEERPLNDLWERRSPILSEGATFDPNRNATPFAEGSTATTAADPLAFLVGRVEVQYGGDPAKNRVTNLAPYINPLKKIVTSSTGEIRLNYGQGVCTVNTPRAQGATGFLSQAGELRLTDLTLRSKNEYASVVAVALDDLPLRTSRKVLVQVGTMMHPTGWATKAATFKSEDGKQSYQGREIVSTGKMPWQVGGTDLSLTLKNAALTKATLLDASGYTKRTLKGTNSGGVFQITAPAETLYLVLE
jgi:hypothetical protein